MKDTDNQKTEYDIVIVLCPAERNKLDRKFPEYDENGKYLGGQTRMDAAVEIYKRSPHAKFIVVGGLDKMPKDLEESVKTQDMKEYLEEKCGAVDVERINSLPCTKHNFIAIFIRWAERNVNLNNKKVGVLTNYFHLPRSFKFLSHALVEYKIDGNPIFIPIAAESIVCQPEIYIKSQEYLLTLKSEVEGMQAIENDKYKDGCLWRKTQYERGKFEDYESIVKQEGGKLLSEADKAFLRQQKEI